MTDTEARSARRAGVAAMVVGAGLVGWWALGRDRAQSVRPPTSLVTPSASGLADHARFVGDGACAECHPGEAAAHARSGHARTLHRARGTRLARSLDGRSVTDPEQPGVTFRYHDGEDGLEVERIEGDENLRAVVDYVMGSGTHGVTFLSTTADPRRPDRREGLEHRLSYRPGEDRFMVTPGQQLDVIMGRGSTRTPMGRSIDNDKLLVCLKCHATALSDRGDERLDEATLIPNITCERCHGPAGAHVAAARSGADDLAIRPSPGREMRFDEIELCGRCHRMPRDVAPDEVRPENAALARFQPIGLFQSRCFRASEALRCSSCHDPHARPSRDIARYEAVCLGCHAGPDRTACSVSPREGCVECHMPRREVGEGLVFRDHWIRTITDHDASSSGR